ncbi:MAG: HDOD domain-containing protein [Desulfobacterales bacterium]|nr:MAG: HDOD domain-containing protein [Desulfobacterales bacterium]
MNSNLEKSLLLESLERLGSGRKTGVLHLTDPSQAVKVYVDNGAVIHISGTNKEARLEYLLIRKKLFSTERIKDLLRIAKKENQPLLQVLLNKKLAMLATLEKLMAFHARHIFLKALAWSDGAYEFKPARIDGNLVTEIRYDCRQLAHDIANEAEGPAKAEKTGAEEISQITGPSLKNTILQKMKELPPTLQTVVKARKMLAGQDTDFEALQRVLETDQSMVAMILKIANSPYYGMSGKISSLKHSITMLGLKTLSQVITLAGTGNFLNQTLKGYSFTAQEVRDHSLAVGFGSRNLAAMVNPAAEEDAFIAGLLHDAGKIMLNPYVAEGQICSNADGREEISDLEKRVLGCDHGEIAAAVFTQWLFPARVVDAIRFHHDPDQSDGNELAYILYASDTLAKIKQDDIPIYEIGSVLNENVSDFLGIEQEDIAAIFIEMKESEKNIA